MVGQKSNGLQPVTPLEFMNLAVMNIGNFFDSLGQAMLPSQVTPEAQPTLSHDTMREQQVDTFLTMNPKTIKQHSFATGKKERAMAGLGDITPARGTAVITKEIQDPACGSGTSGRIHE